MRDEYGVRNPLPHHYEEDDVRRIALMLAPKEHAYYGRQDKPYYIRSSRFPIVDAVRDACGRARASVCEWTCEREEIIWQLALAFVITSALAAAFYLVLPVRQQPEPILSVEDVEPREPSIILRAAPSSWPAEWSWPVYGETSVVEEQPTLQPIVPHNVAPERVVEEPETTVTPPERPSDIAEAKPTSTAAHDTRDPRCKSRHYARYHRHACR